MATQKTNRRSNPKPAVVDEEFTEQIAEYQPDPDPQVLDSASAPVQQSQPAQATQSPSSIPQQRVYADEVVIDHDLYRLKLTSMKKNMAWQPNQFDIVSVQHEHFYHTVDSNGTKQKNSNLVGSHFHQMKVTPNPAGGPPIVECGPAVKEVKRFANGRTIKVIEPYLHYTDEQGTPTVDNHTHVIEYMRSNKIPVRKINAEAIKVIGADAAKGASIPGVIG